MRSACVRRSAWRPSRNCEHPAEPRFGQAREPRSGRSEAKWLDRTADRRTISRRDGRRARALPHVSELARRSRRAGGREAGGRRSTAAAVRNSERVRAHLYERMFRAKPVSRADAQMNRAARRIVRRTRRLTRTASVRPDERDMHLGRERPPRAGPGAKRGVAEGVAHAPLASDMLSDSGADSVTGGTERRPLTVVKSLIAKTSPVHRLTQSPSSRGSLIANRARERGTTAPESVFPPPFLRLRCSWRSRRRESFCYRRGSTGSLSRARTPNTHSCTRLRGSRCTNRSRPSIPSANSRSASDRLPESPRSRSLSRCSGKVYSGP